MITIKTVAIQEHQTIWVSIAKARSTSRQLQTAAPHLAGWMKSSSSLNHFTMKDTIKSYVALGVFLAISFWLLCHYAVQA